MSKHIHADLMLQYAQDAMTTDKPWELWEVDAGRGWVNLLVNPESHSGKKYRRKPRTIKINGFDVPEPVRWPLERGIKYYFVTASGLRAVVNVTWNNDESDRRILARGLIRLTSGAAELHAKALLSFTEVQS